MTKREMYDVIGSVFNTIDNEHKDEVLAFIEKEKEALDRKNEKAKERAAEKRAASDVLKGKIADVIGDEPMTVNAILEALEDEDLTPAKVTARTKKLVSEGVISREMVKVDGRKLTAYVRV